jgi:hypothetical protein
MPVTKTFLRKKIQKILLALTRQMVGERNIEEPV